MRSSLFLMINWQILSPPKIAALFLCANLPLILALNLITLNGESYILLEWEILTLGGVRLIASIILDKIRVIFRITVLLISIRVMLFTITYISQDKNLEYFVYIVIAFVLSINLLIFFPHLIILLIGWDGLGLTSYLLVIYYLNDKSLRAGIVTAITNRLGDALLVASCAYIFSNGNWNITFNSYGVITTVILLIIVATFTKRAQIPFSAWLPAAIAAPTPVSSLVHSSTLVTAGVYLLIRFYKTLILYRMFHVVLFYLGVITCLIARLSAVFQNDLKKIIALSTLRQLGVIIITLGLGEPTLAFFHLVTHAMFKALLFVCAGTIIHSNQDNQDIRTIGNVWVYMPTTAIAINVANLALCGFPFTAGFYSKDSIVETFMMRRAPLTTRIVLIVRVTLTSAYSIRLSLLLLWSPYKGTPITLSNDERKYTFLPCAILISGAICRGAILRWYFNPSSVVIIMPIAIKLLTLSIVTLFAVRTFILTLKAVNMKGVHFIRRMWFLSFITSPPLTHASLSTAAKVFYNEIRWIELIRGKGIFQLTSIISKATQKRANIRASQIMSIFRIFIFITLLTI